ncbi:hypothetical protein [Desulfococcus sp.]|uniref:hypothetical protein n=1 Tax=Desulfococcus sp. TaxID=2025834 RepID=UPI00359471B4
MNVSRIQEILDARYLAGEAFRDRKIWSAGGGELMSDLLKPAAKDGVLLTGLATIEVIRRSVAVGVGCIVFVRGKKVPQAIIDAAVQYRLPLLSTAYPLFVACGHLYMNGLKGFEGAW